MTVHVADLADFDTCNRAHLDRLAGAPLVPRTTTHVAASNRYPLIEIDGGGRLTDSDMNLRNGS